MAIIMHNTSRRIGESYIAPIGSTPPPHAHEDYLTQFDPMRRAKIQAAMDRFMRLDGTVMRRWEAAGKIIASGSVRHDKARGRLYHGDGGCFYDVPGLTRTMVDYIMWRISLSIT